MTQQTQRKSARGTSARKARAPARKSAARGPTSPTRRWSKHVNETSDAMDIEPEIFKRGSAKAVATSLKRSAERSTRRKATPFRSAMSMLNFYLNRAGKNLPQGRRRVLERAKDELRGLYGRST